MRLKTPLIGLLGLGMGCGAAGDSAPPAAIDYTPEITLNSRSIDTRKGEVSLALEIRQTLRADSSDEKAMRIALVKFPAPITEVQDRAMREAASAVYSYLPSFAYIVQLPGGDQLEEAKARILNAGASFVGAYHPAYKLSRAVMRAGEGEAFSEYSRAKQGFERHSVMLQIYPGADTGQVRSALAGLGLTDIQGISEGKLWSRIRLLLTPRQIGEFREALARLPEVFWIDIEPRKSLLNDTTVWVGQSGLSANMSTPVFDHGIYGQGQVVAVLDTGLDPDMCYFRDPAAAPPPRNECNGGTQIDAAQRKVLAVNFLDPGECAGGIANNEWDTQDHGTHVAGTVAGDNFASPVLHDAGDGMAPAAKLVIQDGGYAIDNCGDLPGIGCPVIDLKPLFQQTYDQGARIHSDSWGDQENNPIQNNYTAACQDVDEFMWNHKDFLIVFAAGNSGSAAGSVGSPASAKSTVAVGATERGLLADTMANFSSCGPTDDGRIKPEVVIPGAGIISANADNNAASNNCNTRSMSGTSMAAPAAAGLSALVRQYFSDGFYPSGMATPADGFIPSAALVRGTLVHSTVALNANVMPSNCHAWGRILLDSALYFAGDAKKLWVIDESAGFATGSSNETLSISFTVHSNTQPLKATLAWTDYPSTPAANPHINNDIDLEVVGPLGTYAGNAFMNGQSKLGGSPDRINTVEQVYLKQPPPGEYTVTVRSFNIPNGSQPYALIFSADATEAGSLGASCILGTDCDSGFCADGVCCNTACDAGECDACSQAAGASQNGQCSLLSGNPCNDGDACSQSDICQSGTCTGSNPVICAALDACHDIGICDPATGLCSQPNKADQTPCDDGDACTQIDTCQSGLCTGGSPVVCAALDNCHVAGVCDPMTGVCDQPIKADGDPCDDANGCTESDTCTAGVCSPGSPKVCPDMGECQVSNGCDSMIGECVYNFKADGTPCGEGQCQAGACIPISASSSSSSGSSSGSSSSGAGGGAAGDPGVEGGCGCGVADTSGRSAWSAVALLLLLGLRRRPVMSC